MSGMGFINNETSLESREGQLTLMALVMMLYVMAVFAAIAVHEALGHGLATVLLGGDFYAIYLSPSSGYISFYLPDSMPTTHVAFIYMAGILVQIAAGLAVLFLVFPRVKGFIRGIFTLLFSAALLVHPSLYLFMGYFYPTGDTRYAVVMLQVQPDIFLIAGLIMTGLFVILISTAALNFLGSFIDMEAEAVRNRILLIFWLPVLLLGGLGALASAFYVPSNETAYTIVNAALVLFFLGIAIFLVPVFVEPPRTRNAGLSFRGMFSVMVVFLVLLSTWVGVFGLSQESAHGLMLHEPPLGAERYYLDYTIGNADIFMYRNRTARISIILRNQLDNPPPLKEEIFHTFDYRPDWGSYIQRSRNMVLVMFGLSKDTAQNLSFSTGLGTVRAKGVEDSLGRICTTYLENAGSVMDTRSVFHEGVGSGISLHLTDPWSNLNPRGFLDEVRVSWGDDLRLDAGFGENDLYDTIPYNRGSLFNRSIGWKNVSPEESPTSYSLIFTKPITATVT